MTEAEADRIAAMIIELDSVARATARAALTVAKSANDARAATERQNRLLIDIEGLLQSTLPMIATRLDSAIQVGEDGRDHAAVAVEVGRDVSTKVTTMAANGGGHAGAIREAVSAIRQLPWLARLWLGLLGTIAVVGWALHGFRFR